MNTLTHRLAFLAFLGCAMLLLPACGSKNEVKTEKAPETVLNPEATPLSSESTHGTADIGMPGEGHTPINAYVEKIKRTKTAKGTQITLTPSTEAGAAAATPESTPVKTPAVVEAAPPPAKSGSHWFWWVLLVLVVGGVGYYFYSKNQSGGPFQPMPPTGGLSPVSGFTAVKENIEDEAESKSSIWNRKLF